MLKKILLLFTLIIFCTPAILAEDAYVSPENYAVNEADLTDYMSIPAPSKNYKSSGHSRKSKYKEPKPPSRMEENIKSWLREKRYNAQEPHHGELHEIKVNSKYKQQENNNLPEVETLENETDLN
ncbi:MAG: hypothetical protein ACLSWI_08575 [Candidatus Gastranaerophilaceae bacterium]